MKMNIPISFRKSIIALSVILSSPIGAFENSLSSITGVDLKSMKSLNFDLDKNTVLAFVSSRCPCSQSHEEILSKLANEFADFNFVGIHSNSDEPLSEAQNYFKHSKISFPIISDPKSTIADKFRALKTPHVFVIASKQILYSGGITNTSHAPNSTKNYLRDVLVKIRNGSKEITPPTRTLGCQISRPNN